MRQLALKHHSGAMWMSARGKYVRLSSMRMDYATFPLQLMPGHVRQSLLAVPQEYRACSKRHSG
jgi:hypothetical protein